MDFISVNDELQVFKAKARECGWHIKKIEKIGNGNMSAFKAFYTVAQNEEVKELFFWRHALDEIIQKMEEKYLNK